VRESSGLFGRSCRAADERSVDLATVWLRYDGGIAVFDAVLTGRAGMGGGWGMGERIGAAEGGRQAAPKAKAEKGPFGGSAPPGIFSHWGHVTRPQTEYFWLGVSTPVRDHNIWVGCGPLGSLWGALHRSQRSLMLMLEFGRNSRCDFDH